ncbi:MAG: methionine adenosyltransferase [Gammaproteobacteria bacterium AqS3]|nr:methionine adenosyltransferase [Gammaproteobacteria bacterium AqS3]
MRYRSFTSESVSEGHPDKLCDQISDAILDEYLRRDPEKARVACEVMAKDNRLILGGECYQGIDNPPTEQEIKDLAREVVRSIGYDDAETGLDADTCAIDYLLGGQSDEIHSGVDKSESESIGAGDQGLMFGYACTETPSYMPAPIHYAHELMRRAAERRRSGAADFLRPDAKSQVTVEYGADGAPAEITHVVLSTQHDESIGLDELRGFVREQIINAVLPDALIADLRDENVFINPAGTFHVGGPKGDCGLTGRKIIVDTYGGMAHHGGGAFSGKDPSKVDRSAAYYCRYVAKNLVAAALASSCEIQVAYAIGHPDVISLSVNTFGTGDDAELERLLKRSDLFDWTPGGLIERLGLCAPIYSPTAAYGHFGRDAGETGLFPWERLDLVDRLRG